MTRSEVQLLILKTLQEANSKGAEWVTQELAKLGAGQWEGDDAKPIPEFLNHVTSLSEAVVKAVGEAGHFVTARTVAKMVGMFPLVLMESDQRMKRRKVSQALYTQKDKTLISVKMPHSTMWGLKAWTLEDGDPDLRYSPTDINEEDEND